MDIEALKNELEDKDELVQALTLQLEQAAEQLDRFRRSGAKQADGAGSGNSTNLSAQHQALTEDVSYLVEQWNASQLAGSIGRVEMQLEEMRDLITNLSIASPAPSSADSGSDYGAMSELDAEASHANLLDSIQAAFQEPSDQIPETVIEESPEGMIELSTQSLLQSSSDSDQAQLTSLEELPEQPDDVDFDLASSKELKEAILERDRYIKVIVDHFSAARKQFGIRAPEEWEKLEGCPDELVARVQQLEKQLEDQLRLSEVSLSLERARISREETELNAARIQIQKDLRKQGVDPRRIRGLGATETDNESEVVVDQKEKGTKWLNMLRIKSDS